MDAVAPPMIEQFAPRLSHRSHAYVNVNVAGNPVHVPFVVVSDWSLAALPDSDGATVFCGEPVTTAVAFEFALAVPLPLVAVSVTRSVLPWSAVTGVYVDAVAPPMSTQFAPAESHCRHWNVNVGAGKPVHVPVDAVSSWPRDAVPVIAGTSPRPAAR